MHTSIFDLFKIGIGPSSSHTVGPMRAARQCLILLNERGVLDQVARVRVHLYGSLALTGLGHGTDRAILLGLSGEKPDEVDPDRIESLVGNIRREKTLCLFGTRQIPFDEQSDVSLRGFSLYQTGSLEETRRIASSDPSVVAGRLEIDVMNFYCPKGIL